MQWRMIPRFHRAVCPQGQEGLSVSAPRPYLAHMLQRTLRAGFIAPCLPTKTDKLPCGDLWLHEIKHDGFRVIARKDGDRVRLYTRPGNDLTRRFPLIAEALTGLRSRSCIIDGEAVACDDNGIASVTRRAALRSLTTAPSDTKRRVCQPACDLFRQTVGDVARTSLRAPARPSCAG